MERMPRLQKILLPLVALAVGLLIGLAVGQFQAKKEQKIAQDKIREAGKKIAFIQKKTAEEKDEAVASLEQKSQADLEKAASERKALGGQLAKLQEQARGLEDRTKIADASASGAKKELQEANRKYAQADQLNKDLERELQKTAAEKEAAERREKAEKDEKAELAKKAKSLQEELQKTVRSLAASEANNADLVVIAEELVKAYREKGIGAAILEREPLTQIRKVEMEKLARKYQDAIEQKKINRK